MGGMEKRELNLLPQRLKPNTPMALASSWYLRGNKVEASSDDNTWKSTTIPENEPTKPKAGKYQTLLKEFSQESSAGGINKIFSSKPTLIRSIWVVLCIVCYGAMVFLSFVAVKTYYNNPTSTFIDVSFETVSKY